MGSKIRWLDRKQPIAVINDRGIICYYKGKIWLRNNGAYRCIGSLRETYIDRLKECTHFCRRLFRQEIRCSIFGSDGRVYFLKDSILFSIDLEDYTINKAVVMERNMHRPLNLAEGNNIYTVIWGDYFDNPGREPVSIYGLTMDGNIEELYSFPKETIRHIHNIVKRDNGYIIFTGDNDGQAGIYISDIYFRKIEAVLIGDQQARAVVGFPVEGGILYATDSVSQENSIYLLEINEANNVVNRKKITKINGSVIYGAVLKNGWVFSTTVESSERDRESKSIIGKIKEFLSTERGNGILSNNVHILYVNKNYDVHIMIKLKKDSLPYKLFQYGSIRFPIGQNQSEKIVFYPVAVKKYDGWMGLIEMPTNTDAVSLQ